MNHVSLFTGSGIPCLAAASVGMTTVAVCENDPACCYALRRLWPEAILFDDVRTADWSQVPQPVFMLDAGVPCQPVSTAGKQKGDKDERWLWPETIRAVRELRPRWLLFENPSAIILHGLERIVAELEDLGYEFFPKGPDGRFTPLRVGAWAVGAPHKRDRVWIVARLGNAGCERRQQNAGSSSCDEETHGRAGRKQREPDSDNQPDGASEIRLADPIGNLCGRGGDESEWGPEGRTAVGWAGEELGNPASDDQRRPSVATMHGKGEPTRGSSGGCGELANSERDGHQGGESARGTAPGVRRRSPEPSCSAVADSDSPRLPLPMCERGDPREEQPAAIRSRWPSRPGEPQHAWEAPRLVEFGLGDATDGLSRRVRSRANKAALRICGNAWCYPVAEMMFRAIAELDGEHANVG